MNTTFTATFTVGTDKIVPFAKSIGWQEKVTQDVLDPTMNILIPSVIDNPVTAVQFINQQANTLLTNWMAPFAKAQVDLQAAATLASIEASKEQTVSDISKGITITAQ